MAGITATVAVAKFVGELVSSAVDASLDDSVKSSEMTTKIAQWASERKVLGSVDEEVKFVKSPIFVRLVTEFQTKSDSRSHVLFAGSSEGKTTGTRAFFRYFLGKNEIEAPGLMIAGNEVSRDYLAYMASKFGIHKPEEYGLWLKCLFSALRRPMDCDQPHSVLVLDEFNHVGENDVNLVFAKALCRAIYDNKCNFTIIFVTQDLDVATRLCALNDWQKIGPFPSATEPCRSTVKHRTMVPPTYAWVPTKWTRVLLTQVVLATYPELSSEIVGNALPWLDEGHTPTAALAEANSRLNANMAQRENAMLFLEGVQETEYLG